MTDDKCPAPLPGAIRSGGVQYVPAAEPGGFRLFDADGRPLAEFRAGKLDLFETKSLSDVAARGLSDALARFYRHGDLRPPTRVCSVRGLTPDQIAARGIVYVGREHRRRCGLSAGATLLPRHPLHNPYRLPKNADAEDKRIVCSYFERHLRADPNLLALARGLRGRLLGCWCGEWDGSGEPGLHCHAVNIARAADE